MRIFTKSTLREYWERHPDVRTRLADWYRLADNANWDTPAKVLADYPSASIVGRDRVVFRIKGNDYRLVVAINYQLGRVYIRFIGTHAEYDRINVEEV